MGLCLYYRRLIADISKLAEPLTRPTCDDVSFVWSTEQQEVFAELRQRLHNPPVLAHFDEDAATEIHTDASNVGLRAVLFQKQQGVEKLIAYASSALSGAEEIFPTPEKECLAVVWATMKFRPYLYSRAFKVITEHHSLSWLAILRDPSGRIARCSLRMQEFYYSIEYKSGQKHEDADTLSRAPVVSANNSTDDDSHFLGIISTCYLKTRARSTTPCD